MGILGVDLMTNPRRQAHGIGAETNKIKDLCKCHRECQNFLRRVGFFMRMQHGQLPRNGKDIDI